MGDIDKALEAAQANKPLNKPLGSGMSGNEWLATAEAIQDYVGYLRGYGYSNAEVAAALVYGQYLVRSDTGRARSGRKSDGSGSSGMVTTYKNGKPELVPRYRKSVNGSKTASTYTTKQFVPYTGIVVPASVMTFVSGKPNTEVYKIADIHKGQNGAWLEGANNGNGFAVNVFKDSKGWYMSHRRLGHEDSNGNWSERVYLEDLRKRVGF